MKKQLLLFIPIFAITFASGQTAQNQTKEQTIFISINSIPTLKACTDTAISGHKVGEVIVENSMTPKNSLSYSKKDTNITYQIHFYKTYKNKLRDYMMEYVEKTKYDNASYSWLNDTTVVVILMNSATKERRKVKLFQTFCDKCSPGIDTDSLKEK